MEGMIYLDYAAATPIDEGAKHEMMRYLSGDDALFGNPSSLHSLGQAAHGALADARSRIARLLNAHHSELLFFSSATEANNFALRSVAKKYAKNTKKIPHLLISGFEHPSVFQTAEDLQKNNEAQMDIIPVRPDGTLDIKRIPELLKENTALVSVIYVQNEIGALQDLKKIKESIRARFPNPPYPLLHTDAAQGYLYPLDTQELGVDMMTIASYKVYGPKGAAALYIRGTHTDMRDVVLPLITGGNQEKGMRGGTENLPAIMGFAKALETTVRDRDGELKRLKGLSERFFEGLKKEMPEIERNPANHDPSRFSPHICNIYFPGGENLDKAFDMAKVAASSGSACLARAPQKSHTLAMIGLPEERIRGSIRFSLGKQTTRQEIDEAVKRIILTLRKQPNSD